MTPGKEHRRSARGRLSFGVAARWWDCGLLSPLVSAEWDARSSLFRLSNFLRRLLPLWARLALVGAAAGMFFFLCWRGSPVLRELWFIPAPIASWADYHGVLRNIPAFMALALVVRVMVARGRLIMTTLALFAILLESGQLFLPGRYFDFADIFASLFGLALGVLADRALGALTVVSRQTAC